jgi:hypothetical protein
MHNFNFNSWAALARTAPDEFEQRRRDVDEILYQIAATFTACVDCNVTLTWKGHVRTPLKTCLHLSTLMWDAFIDLNNELNTLANGSCTKIASSHIAKSAKIIHISLE